LRTAAIALPAVTGLSTARAETDWNQWRGPARNGILPQSRPLMNSFPAEGLKELWDSETIPSNDDGGLSSVVVSGNRAYVSVVWHSDVPSETRTINDLVMRQLGYQSTASWNKELVAKMEADREALSRRYAAKSWTNTRTNGLPTISTRNKRRFFQASRPGVSAKASSPFRWPISTSCRRWWTSHLPPMPN